MVKITAGPYSHRSPYPFSNPFWCCHLLHLHLPQPLAQRLQGLPAPPSQNRHRTCVCWVGSREIRGRSTQWKVCVHIHNVPEDLEHEVRCYHGKLEPHGEHVFCAQVADSGHGTDDEHVDAQHVEVVPVGEEYFVFYSIRTFHKKTGK